MDLETLIPEQTAPAPSIQLNEHQKKICELSPAHFDQFVKILSLLEGNEIIIIENSHITQEINKGTAILSTDISQLIGPDINLHILNPVKYLRLFKMMKGNNNIEIIDDKEQSRYLVSNGDIEGLMPQRLEALESLEPFDFSTDCEYIGTVVKFSKEERRVIRNCIMSSEFAEIIVKDNQPKAVHVPDTVNCKFPEYNKEGQLNETNADYLLKSFNFLSIDGETYDMILAKKADRYHLITQINNGYLNVQVTELVELSNDDNLLI